MIPAPRPPRRPTPREAELYLQPDRLPSLPNLVGSEARRTLRLLRDGCAFLIKLPVHGRTTVLNRRAGVPSSSATPCASEAAVGARPLVTPAPDNPRRRAWLRRHPFPVLGQRRWQPAPGRRGADPGQLRLPYSTPRSGLAHFSESLGGGVQRNLRAVAGRGCLVTTVHSQPWQGTIPQARSPRGPALKAAGQRRVLAWQGHAAADLEVLRLPDSAGSTGLGQTVECLGGEFHRALRDAAVGKRDGASACSTLEPRLRDRERSRLESTEDHG